MKRNAIIHIELPSDKMLKISLKALLPEAKKSTTSRSKISIKGEGRKLIMRIWAEDTSAFRATLNSYLRWVVIVKNTCEAAVSLEKTSLMCENT